MKLGGGPGNLAQGGIRAGFPHFDCQLGGHLIR